MAIRTYLHEPLWPWLKCTAPSDHATYLHSSDACDERFDQTVWTAFVTRTSAAFDESRTERGFLKTYRPVSLAHMSVDELRQRRDHVRSISCHSWALCYTSKTAS